MNHVHRPVLLIVLLMISIQARANERPNVVIVMTDDQGYPEVSAHGNPARGLNIIGTSTLCIVEVCD